MNITDLKELSPFLAVIASILALSLGPYISGLISRNQSKATMREKWIYAFRDTLVELITELDVLAMHLGEEGIFADDDPEEAHRKLSLLANRVSLMINTDEELYEKLYKSIDKCLSGIFGGITDIPKYCDNIDVIKVLASEAIRHEWKKI